MSATSVLELGEGRDGPLSQPLSGRPRCGVVVTYYSYKGGVGRSMALANMAALLAKRGRRVLVLDWDLDAPGIERYFDGCLEGSRREFAGLVDLVTAFVKGESIPWRKARLTARPFRDGAPIHLISAGRLDEAYSARASALDWDRAFSKHALGDYLDTLRDEWKHEYDFILVDSRTGITDIGGICTVLLPDIVFVVFTTNHQSIEGVKQVTEHARAAHQELALDRGTLVFVPVLGRDESQNEHELAMEWRARAAAQLKPLFAGWLPTSVDPLTAMSVLKVPYKARWSFGEALPVVTEGVTDPSGPGFAYGLLTALLDSRLDWDAALEGKAAGLSAELRADAANAQKSELEKAVTDLKARLEVLSAEAEASARLAKDTSVEKSKLMREAARGARWARGSLVTAVLAILTASAVSLYEGESPQQPTPLLGLDAGHEPTAVDAGVVRLPGDGGHIPVVDAGAPPPFAPTSRPPPTASARPVTSEERRQIRAQADRVGTGRYLENGLEVFRYRMWIEAPREVADQIQSVDYFFDNATFEQKHYRSSFGPRFAQSYEGYGCVEPVVTVTFRDRKTAPLLTKFSCPTN